MRIAPWPAEPRNAEERLGAGRVEAATGRPFRVSRLRIVYWNNIPSPYMVSRLNAVADRGAFDVEAWFCARTESDRAWTVDDEAFRFPHRYLPGASNARWVGGHHVNLPLPLMERATPDLLVSIYADPTFIVGLSLARARGVRVALRYLPTFDQWIHRTRVKEWAKRQLFSRVDGFKTPGPAGIARLVTYGVDPVRIHTVTQSVDVGHFIRGSDTWRPRRDEVRNELGLRGCVFTFVGRLWQGKGLDHLITAYGSLAAASQIETTLMLVGDGRDEPRYRAEVARMPAGKVVFTGFVQQPDLPRLYAASDVFVFPTLGDPNGLVVEEAMICGLPVIAFSSAGDISLRVPEGIAGHVVPTADTEALQARMTDLAQDESSRRRMGEAGRALASTKTHERYAQEFELFVERVMASRRLGAGRRS